MAPPVQHDEQQDRKLRRSVSSIVLWITCMLALLNLAGYIGNYFVLGERQAVMSATIDKQDVKLGEHEKTLTQIDVWRQVTDKFDVDTKSHINDKSIHLTSEQASALIATQLTPISLSMKEVQVHQQSQQQQLDRIEKLLQKMVETRESPQKQP